MPGSPQKRARRAAAAQAEVAAGLVDELAEDPKPRERPRKPWANYEPKDGPPPYAEADPVEPRRDRHPKVRCEHVSRLTERQCRHWAMKDADPPKCQTHAGRKEKTRAMIAHELRQWQLGDTKLDPAECLLRLVSQSAIRLDKLSTELAELVDEQGLQDALIGEVRVPSENGSYVSGDYVRGLARLEGEERDRLAQFSKIAISAGLETRRVELAASQGQLMAQVLRRVLGAPELGLSDEQLELVPGLLRSAQEVVFAESERAEQPVDAAEIEGVGS